MDEKTTKQLKDRIYFKFNLHNVLWLSTLTVVYGALTLFNRRLFFGVKADGVGYRYMHLIFLFGFTALAALLLSVISIDIPQLLRRILSWALLIGLAPYCAYCVEWMNQTYLVEAGFFHPPYKWTANSLIYLMLVLLLYAITRRFFLTAVLNCCISLVFGTANYFVTQFRGTPILPWDLQAVGTAADVANGYEITFTSQILYTIFATLLLLVLIHKLEPDFQKDGKKLKILERVLPLAVSLGLMVAVVPMDSLSAMGISVYPWNQKLSTKMTGVAAGFFGNLQFMMVDKPVGYSAGAVKNIESQTQQLPALAPATKLEKQPTVIAIMNESLTDMMANSNGNLTLSEDNMPFLHSLMEAENVISGTAYASVTGGGTCDSEFEFLTGDTKAFLPVGSKPYQQYIQQGQFSLVSTLQEQGYQAFAIHPGQHTAWNRNVAYPALGFEDFISASSFHTDREFIRELTADFSCYNELIYRYEQHQKASENPLFLFNVTIQNHGGYGQAAYESTVQITGEEGNYPQAEQYLSLVKNSDTDFQYLINYFEKQEDPVIILMYGDHWPTLEDDFVKKVLGVDDLDSLSIADTMRTYQVPYIVWANYPIDNTCVNMEHTSLNYLSSLLLHCAGLELPDYSKFLLNLHETVPVVTEIGIIGSDGTAYKHTDTVPFSDALNEYSILQYNHLFDKKNAVSTMFTVGAGE